MVSTTSVEIAEWISLIGLAALWAVISWLVNAARILRADKLKIVNLKHKETRFSTTMGMIAFACLLIGACVLIVWTNEGDGSKTDSGTTIVVQYFRWIGIGLFLFFMSWAYANYSGMFETDWRHLQVLMFFGGLSGTLSTFVINKQELQIAGYVFTAFFYAVACFDALRYTNIKIVGWGWNYLVWAWIYMFAPIVFYVLLIVGPEGTKVENRSMIAIGYLVVSVATAIFPPIIIALTFMGTKKIAIDVLTYVLRKRKVGSEEMENLDTGDSVFTDDLVDTMLSANGNKRHRS